MRKGFTGHYRPTEVEFTSLWDNCIFVLDANVLLNLYRYSTETTSELLDILSKISNRLWIPFQIASEYQEKRLEVISKQKDAYNEIDKLLNQAKNQIQSGLNNYLKHPLIDIKSMIGQISTIFNKIIEELRKQESNHPDLTMDDNLRERITFIFDGKVGLAYSPDKLKSIFEEGEKRYEKLIPPGFSDGKKDTNNKFGDLVLWYQIIDKAVEINKPIIFVTDDTKEDWWWIFKGKTIGPRPEIVQEFLLRTNQLFYIYSSDQFMEYAKRYLRQEVKQRAINEVREVRKQDSKSAAILRINQIRLARINSEINQYKSKLNYYEKEINVTTRELMLLEQEYITNKSELGMESQNILSKKLGICQAKLNESRQEFEKAATMIDKLYRSEDILKNRIKEITLSMDKP